MDIIAKALRDLQRSGAEPEMIGELLGSIYTFKDIREISSAALIKSVDHIYPNISERILNAYHKKYNEADWSDYIDSYIGFLSDKYTYSIFGSKELTVAIIEFLQENKIAKVADDYWILLGYNQYCRQFHVTLKERKETKNES